MPRRLSITGDAATLVGGMQTIALFIIALSGLWLIGVAALMAAWPRRFLDLLRLTASSWRVNITEQGLRLLAGLALIVRAGSSKLPWLFETGGWFVVGSSIILLVMPLRLHSAYAIWWSHRLKPWAVRATAPFSAMFGVGLVYAAL